MAGRCRAASRRSRRAATTTTRWATRRSRRCARSGTAPAYQDFRAAPVERLAAAALRELRVAMEPLAVARRHPDAERGRGDRRRRCARLPRDVVARDHRGRWRQHATARGRRAAAGARVVVADGAAAMAAPAPPAPRRPDPAAASSCFMDGDGADRGDLMAPLVEPIRGRHA